MKCFDYFQTNGWVEAIEEKYYEQFREVCASYETVGNSISSYIQCDLFQTSSPALFLSVPLLLIIHSLSKTSNEPGFLIIHRRKGSTNISGQEQQSKDFFRRRRPRLEEESEIRGLPLLRRTWDR